MRLQRQLDKLGRGAILLLLVMVVGGTLVLGAGVVRLAWSPIVLPVYPPQPLVRYLDRPVFINGPIRPIYRHSIVPGGVYSAEEIQAAMLRDPVVTEHYAKLDRSRIVGAVLEQPRAVYVSYRIGHRTMWTSTRIVLPAGERLLTDGTRVVRARCGNLVSETGAEEGVADASGERIDPAELDLQAPPVLVGRGPEPLIAASADVPLVATTPGLGLAGQPGPFFQPVGGVLPFVLGGGVTTTGTPPPTTSTTTTGTVPPTTTTTTTTGVVPPTTTTGYAPPTTTTITFSPTSGTVPEPSRFALLVLAWVAYRYRRRAS